MGGGQQIPAQMGVPNPTGVVYPKPPPSQLQPPLIQSQPGGMVGDMNAQFANMSMQQQQQQQDNNKPAMQTHAGILDSGPPQNGFYNRRYNQSFNSPRMDYGGGGGGYRGGYNNGYNNNNNSAGGGGREQHYVNDWGRPMPVDVDLEK